MSVERIVSKLEEYLQIPAVTHFEEPFKRRLADDFSASGCAVEDRGKLLAVTKAKRPSKRIVTAHIDRHGLAVDDAGQIRYAAHVAKRLLGEDVKDSNTLLTTIAERFFDQAVFAYTADGKPLCRGTVRTYDRDFDARTLTFRVDGFKRLKPRTPIAYETHLSKVNGYLAGQIDNAVSVAVMRQLMDDGFDGTLLLPVEEEIGQSWKHILDYLRGQRRKNDIITLDTTPYEDETPVTKGWVSLRNKDQHGAFNPHLVEQLRDAAQRLKISIDMKDEGIEAHNKLVADGSAHETKKLGTTELGRIVENSNGAFNGATVQLPTNGYHTNKEMTSWKGVESYYRFLAGVLL